MVYSGRETPIGFVTLDNIFQVIIGRVRDEFHKIEESWTIAPSMAATRENGLILFQAANGSNPSKLVTNLAIAEKSDACSLALGSSD